VPTIQFEDEVIHVNETDGQVTAMLRRKGNDFMIKYGVIKSCYE
jgi:hypothetical protein